MFDISIFKAGTKGMTNSFQMKCIDFLTTIENTYFASYRTLVLHDCCPISFSAYTILYDGQFSN